MWWWGGYDDGTGVVADVVVVAVKMEASTHNCSFVWTADSRYRSLGFKYLLTKSHHSGRVNLRGGADLRGCLICVLLVKYRPANHRGIAVCHSTDRPAYQPHKWGAVVTLFLIVAGSYARQVSPA